MKIGMIRHGATDWNKEQRMQGNLDIPLNNGGILEAEKLADRLAAGKWDIIYSSDLARAKQTAEIIRQKLPGAAVFLKPGLREAGGGLVEGTTEKDRIAKWGRHWRECDLQIEKDASIKARGLACIDEIIKNHPEQNVLVVSHGTFLSYLLHHLLPEENMEDALDNCSLTILELTAAGEWHLKLYNCTCHMKQKNGAAAVRQPVQINKEIALAKKSSLPYL